MRRLAPSRADFIPRGAIKIVPKGLDLEIYLYADRQGSPCAMVFGGRRNKPDLHVRYAKPERRDAHLREHVENARRTAEYKAEQAAKRVSYQQDGPGYVPLKHGSCSKWDGRPKYCSWYA